MKRVAMADRTRPMPSPASVNARPRLPNESKMALGVAPNAMRNPVLLAGWVNGKGEHSEQTEGRENQPKQGKGAQRRVIWQRTGHRASPNASNVLTRATGWFLSTDQIACRTAATID